MENQIKQKAVAALKANDAGQWTIPAPGLYPHQWLWDSAFIAIGQRHYDTKRARQEIASLFRGQWLNGMVPHMIFADSKGYQSPTNLWGAKLSPYSPEHVETSGITQPPMLAESVYKIGQSLNSAERKKWYRTIFPYLVDYHQWIYNDRDPHSRGLAVLIHPWETGMDNTPPWMEAMRSHQMPLWIKLFEFLKLDVLVERLRRDTRQISPDERMTTIDSLLLVNVVRRLRRKNYDIDAILQRSHFIIEDVFFNSIFIKANQRLRQIAKEIDEKLPDNLIHSMNMSEVELDRLWSEPEGIYYSRNFITNKIIPQKTIANIMPLYAGSIPKKRADKLVEHLKKDGMFDAEYPVPSVPLNSPYFSERRYWQGPTWVNTNWLLIEGLKTYGYDAEALKLKKKTIELAQKSDFFEYFSPLDGYGAGIAPFSWTAALILDLIES